ncbi:MAG TPA: rhodanese-like domain-containing protein [Candidatus Limnocylindria bacterium]|nr:rhodanese-like domain-containing protein [Candidatus Limnocylindria bacterium]
MTTALVVLAGLAAVAAGVWLGRRLTEVERQLPEIRRIRRELGELREELERALAVTRDHLARTIAGEPPEPDVARRGQAWTDLQAAPALVLYERNPDLFVLDVRTEAEFARGHIPRATLIPVDELEDRLRELPARDVPMLVTCAAGGRSQAACQTLARHGYTRLYNLVGGMHAWAGPRVEAEPEAPPPGMLEGTRITHRGGPISAEQVVAALRECYDPEIPLNIFDLGLVYDIDIQDAGIAITMTLTSESCPSARTIPEDVRRRVSALGQPNVTVDVVFAPPWHPARISPDGKQRLGLA